MDDEEGLWLRCFQPAPECRVRLLCLPHAGGSASSYLRFARSLAPDIEVLAVQYPGRQDRRAEPCLESIHELADRIFTVVRHRMDASTALFGHSMGAVIAFELALRLERELGIVSPGLFASGRRAPTQYRNELVHASGDAAVLAELQKLGGTDLRVLENQELLEAALPALRADYRAIGTYRGESGAAVSCPVTVLVGDADPRTSLDEAHAWREHTTEGCEVLTFPGGHFFLDTNHSEVIHTIMSRLLPLRLPFPHQDTDTVVSGPS